MNLINCSLLVYFAGGSAVIGGYFWGPVGALIGTLVGFILLQVLCYFVRRQGERQPWCRCGATECGLVEHPTLGYVHQCRACCRNYVMRKGWIWDEVLPSSARLPFLRRNFWGKWRPVNP